MPAERDIERQLRAAAGQRRRAAGGKFELHPATRRMLRGEIQRVHGPKTTALGGRNPIYFKFWLRLASGVGTVAILGVAVWVMFFRPPPPAPTQIAKYAPPHAHAAAGRAAAPAAAAKALAPGASAGYVQTAAPLAAPRAEIPAAAARGAGDFSEDKSADAAAKPAAPLPPASVAANPPPSAGALAESAPTQNFRYLNNVGGGGRKKDALTPVLAAQVTESAVAAKAAPRPAAVLNSFQLEQRGDQLRIVDGDGSVYAGQLLAATESDKASQTAAFAAERAVVVDGAAGGAANVRFTAAGTNLSLRQNVVINASFVNGSIVGHAVLADGQSVRIEAAQANP